MRASFEDSFFAISGDNGTTPLEGLLGYLKTGGYASLFLSRKDTLAVNFLRFAKQGNTPSVLKARFRTVH